MVEANNSLGGLQRKDTKRSAASRRKDTGIFWDEPLDLYLDGAININLYNNVLGFNAGDAISGTIDIVIKKTFEASELVVEFKGVERSHMSTDDVISVKDIHREVKEIISMR